MKYCFYHRIDGGKNCTQSFVPYNAFTCLIKYQCFYIMFTVLESRSSRIIILRWPTNRDEIDQNLKLLLFRAHTNNDFFFLLETKNTFYKYPPKFTMHNVDCPPAGVLAQVRLVNDRRMPYTTNGILEMISCWTGDKEAKVNRAHDGLLR